MGGVGTEGKGSRQWIVFTSEKDYTTAAGDIRAFINDACGEPHTIQTATSLSSSLNQYLQHLWIGNNIVQYPP